MTDIAERELAPPIARPSVYYDVSDAEFSEELARVMAETEIERQWMSELGSQPFETDADIAEAAVAGRLQRVQRGTGYLCIQLLAKWNVTRSDPAHQFHYSPPFLTPESLDFLTDISSRWQTEMGESRFLSVTSLVRSMEYQRALALRPRKLTVVAPDMLSSHVMGWSFDIDGCGLYEEADNGTIRGVNPRSSGYNSTLAAEGRLVLRNLLSESQRSGAPINFVEELPGTAEHCFHVCVRPDYTA